MSADKSISFPYIQLGSVYCEKLGINSSKITMHHALGIIQITGTNLERLLDFLDKEWVTIIRQGISEDEDGPKVRQILFLENEE